MTRTTLSIDDGLLRQLKELAAGKKQTVGAVVNDLLRRALNDGEKAGHPLRLKGWDAELQPGVDILDRDKLFDVGNPE